MKGLVTFTKSKQNDGKRCCKCSSDHSLCMDKCSTCYLCLKIATKIENWGYENIPIKCNIPWTMQPYILNFL